MQVCALTVSLYVDMDRSGLSDSAKGSSSRGPRCGNATVTGSNDNGSVTFDKVEAVGRGRTRPARGVRATNQRRSSAGCDAGATEPWQRVDGPVHVPIGHACGIEL